MSDAGFDNGPRSPEDVFMKNLKELVIGNPLYQTVRNLGNRTAALHLPRDGYDAPPLRSKRNDADVTSAITYFPFPGNDEVRNLIHTATRLP